MSYQTNKKEDLDKVDMTLEVALAWFTNDGCHRQAAMMSEAIELIDRIRPDIEEGLKLLAIKRLQDAADDGNSGFITPMER